MHALGYIATSATTEVAVNATTYTEQTSGAQRSLKSASASDTAAGTGVRTVRVVYYTLSSAGAIAGPFSEIVTMNGTAAVATVATNIALVDRLEAVTVGSGGVAAGAISLYTANDGTGTVIASIALGDRRTYLAHAYVPSGSRLFLTGISLTSGEASTAQTLFNLRAVSYPSANVADVPLTGGLGVAGSSGTRQLNGSGSPIAIVQGPARVQMYVAPGASGSTTQRGEFSYYVS